MLVSTTSLIDLTMSLKLYWKNLWWLPEWKFQENHKLHELVFPTNIRANLMPVSYIKSSIYKKFSLSEPCTIVVLPWEFYNGPVPDCATLQDLLGGRYGDISMHKPLQFLLLGAWTFDRAVGDDELRSMIDSINPFSTRRHYVRQKREEQQDEQEEHYASTNRQTSSTTPPHNMETFVDAPPQYTTIAQYSAPAASPNLPRHRITNPSDLDPPPPYTERPVTSNTVQLVMDGAAIRCGSRNALSITPPLEVRPIAPDSAPEELSVGEIMPLIEVLSAADTAPDQNPSQLQIGDVNTNEASTNLGNSEPQLPVIKASHECRRNYYPWSDPNFVCIGVNLPGAYPRN